MGVDGVTVIADATEAGSIGALNRIVAGPVSARFVENAVENAACVTGRIGPWHRRDRGRENVRAAADIADPEGHGQDEGEAGPGTGRAAQCCAEAGREVGRDGQRRDGGLTQ